MDRAEPGSSPGLKRMLAGECCAPVATRSQHNECSDASEGIAVSIARCGGRNLQTI